MSKPAVRIEQLFVALYPLAMVILIDQLSDLVVTLWPPHLELVRWRWGAFGAFVGRLPILLIGDALFGLAAIGAGHRRVIRVWGLLHLLVGPLVLLGLLGFGLDLLQLRASVAPAMARPFYLSSARAGLLALLCGVGAVVVGVESLRVTRSHAGRGESRNILVGLAGPAAGRE